MNEYKSIDYLTEIKKDNMMTNNDIINMLENISYILTDNGYNDARYFIDDIIDLINNEEIKL